MHRRQLKQISSGLVGFVGALVTASAVSWLSAATANTTATITFSYTATDLGNLSPSNGDGPWDKAFLGLNDAGMVVGSTSTSDGHHAVLWQNGTLTNLGPGAAFGINNAAQVVISSYEANTEYSGHAVLWQNGTRIDLGTIGSSSAPSAAFAINNVGQIVGSANGNARGAGHPFLWQNGKMTDLGGKSAAFAINDAGQVVGGSSSFSGRAVLWQNGRQIDLGTLSGAEDSVAYGINKAGQVVGFIPLPRSWGHAFLWQNGSMTDLCPQIDTGGCRAFGINNAGQVVGFLDTGSDSEPYHAVLWQNGLMYDLNSLLPANSGWELQSASAINNRGQIVGLGKFNGQPKTFLLTPVTKPQ